VQKNLSRLGNNSGLEILQIAVHLQQMRKFGPFRKSRKVFQHIQNGPKGFLEHKRASLRTKTQ
jgi:hypothetical protein